MITIAGVSYETRRPADLDAALIAATGCDAAEVATMLGGQPMPGRISAALHPFLNEEGPNVQDLAEQVAIALTNDSNTIVADVVLLLSDPMEEEA